MKGKNTPQSEDVREGLCPWGLTSSRARAALRVRTKHAEGQEVGEERVEKAVGRWGEHQREADGDRRRKGPGCQREVKTEGEVGRSVARHTAAPGPCPPPPPCIGTRPQISLGQCRLSSLRG